MREIDPQSFFRGRVLVTAPHMDDDVLACGGTILRMPRKELVHVAYCTDGRGIVTRRRLAGRITAAEANVGAIRMEETGRALSTLGVPRENARFLGFPEYKVRQNKPRLRSLLAGLVREIRPDCVFTPFRYDRHPDHVALSSVVRDIVRELGSGTRVLEYFVYYQWKLLPAGDIRSYLRPEHLLQTDIRDVSAGKRAALDCFASQTTMFFPWQHKPVLSQALLAAFAQGPEIFLAADAGAADRDLFRLPPPAVRLVHALEPALKNTKESALSLAYRVSRQLKLRRRQCDL